MEKTLQKSTDLPQHRGGGNETYGQVTSNWGQNAEYLNGSK